MDIEEMKEQWAEMDRIRKDALVDNRVAMRKILAKAGIKKVTGSYEDYGDSSGNSTVTELEPDGKTLSDEDKSELEDLIWDFAYDLKPGFENNEGGNGEFQWDIPNDRVDITHRTLIEEIQEHQNI